MRFVITGEWSKNRLLRVILLFFLVYAALFWVTNFLLYFDRMGLTPSSVRAYYLGAGEFAQPRSLRGLAETAHFHTFAMGILVLTLTHLVLFVPVPLGLKGGLVVASFSSAILDEAAGWLVRFVHPAFAVVKVAAFVATQASLGALLLVLAVGMAWPRRNAYADTEQG